ncbi:MAG: sugar phosphate isomerase/epimerase [Spirochaetales bacterium]|nr:sugar phosphate isomerase/epimerase [Spirochaetales bacterium]
MLRIGYRAHDFGSFENVEALGKRLREVDEKTFIQLALKKVIPSAKGWKEWDEEYISSIVETLNSYGVSVGIVGCYIQPTHPDEEKRKEEILRFKKSLSLNKAFGCKLVATETGTRNPSGGYSTETADPKYIEMFYAGLSEMVDAAEKYDAYTVIEAVAHVHTMGSAERMARMMEKFPSERLKVLFDPVNLTPQIGSAEKDGVVLSRPTRDAQAAFYNPILDLYGDRLAAIHCKDYKLDENDGHKIGNIPTFTGVFDWEGFAKEINRRGIDVPWTLENLDPVHCFETVKKLQSF